MRASISLTSFFSSLRSQTIPSQLLVPIIQIISPSESMSPRKATGPGVIRRWRGALGTLGDLTLQLPSQGLTSGARLALARQGCATGSFRLNCSESLYAKDSQGLAMFERIELEEELDKARLGLRERPPMLVSASASTSTDCLSSNQSASQLVDAAVSSDSIDDKAAADQLDNRKTRRPSMRTQRRNMLAVQNMRFDSSGLSSCATFTEGLCHLEDYVRASDVTGDSFSTKLPTIHSDQEISHLSASNDAPNLFWLESLRRKTFLDGHRLPGVVKRRRPTGELVKSLSCMDMDSFSSESDVILTSDTSSSSADDSNHLLEETVKSADYQLVDRDESSTCTSGKLHREGSWARLRHRLSRSLSMKQPDICSESHDPKSSASFAEGLINIFQRRMTTASSQSSTDVFS